MAKLKRSGLGVLDLWAMLDARANGRCVGYLYRVADRERCTAVLKMVLTYARLGIKDGAYAYRQTEDFISFVDHLGVSQIKQENKKRYMNAENLL